MPADRTTYLPPGTSMSVRRALVPTALIVLAACVEETPTETPAVPSMTRAELNTLAAVGASSPRPACPGTSRSGIGVHRILSGNRDISCMTCHMPKFATGDDRSLSIGQGATGFGPERVHPQGAFIPRNAPQLFNMFAVGAAVLGRASIAGCCRRGPHSGGGKADTADDSGIRVRDSLRVTALPRPVPLGDAGQRGQRARRGSGRPGAGGVGTHHGTRPRFGTSC